MRNENIFKLIDNWHVCPYDDDINGMFNSLKLCTEAYLEKHDLDEKTIINIVKDLRFYLNPHQNQNLYYFTDIIADSILIQFRGIDKTNTSEFLEFLGSCEERAFDKI